MFVAMSTLFYLSTNAQEIKFTDLATAERGDYTSYVGSDGGVYKIGDRIKIGVPSSNKTFAFITTGMTSDEALAELKKTKDKLDLGLITQEEYDKKKAELTPFIK